MKFNVLSALISQLREYFTELKDLKNAGIDLTKLEAHQLLYSLFLSYLIETISLSDALKICDFAQSNTEINQSTLEKLYNDLEVNKEVVSQVTENYIVNGKKVSKEAYNEVMNHFVNLLQSSLDNLINEKVRD